MANENEEKMYLMINPVISLPSLHMRACMLSRVIIIGAPSFSEGVIQQKHSLEQRKTSPVEYKDICSYGYK